MSQEKQIDVIDRNELLNTIRDMFLMNFEVPCYSEDRIVQQTVTKIREAIRKQESASGYRKQSEVLIVPEMSDEDIERAIDIIKKNRPQIIADDKSEAWISVDERLPDKEGTYLTYTDKDKILMDVFCIYPSHGTKFWVGGNGKLTHWMPLPEAPKMKGEKNG